VRAALRRIRNELALELPRLQFELNSGLGVTIASACDWVIYNEIFVEGMYDAPIRLAMTPGRHVRILDLGANVGFFTLRCIDLARRAGHADYAITLVEGSPRVVRELRSRMNALPGLEIVHGLVGRRSGSAAITENDFHGKNNIFGDRGTIVDFIDLDRVQSIAGAIDLLKCDIEGAELLFIENYPELLRRVDVAVFELHHRVCDTARCRELLRDCGFTRQTLLTHSKGPDPEFSVYLFQRDAGALH
jgi:FkbM family methyltransferase